MTRKRFALLVALGLGMGVLANVVVQLRFGFTPSNTVTVLVCLLFGGWFVTTEKSKW